jgi:hypothetical protein
MKHITKKAEMALRKTRDVFIDVDINNEDRIQIINQLGIDTYDKCIFIGITEAKEKVTQYRFNHNLSLLELIGVLEKVKNSVLEQYNKSERPVKLKRYSHHDSE